MGDWVCGRDGEIDCSIRRGAGSNRRAEGSFPLDRPFPLFFKGDEKAGWLGGEKGKQSNALGMRGDVCQAEDLLTTRLMHCVARKSLTALDESEGGRKKVGGF